jgi:uncharacterized Zn finger protein (UPF0148 family)
MRYVSSFANTDVFDCNGGLLLKGISGQLYKCEKCGRTVPRMDGTRTRLFCPVCDLESQNLSDGLKELLRNQVIRSRE